MADKPLDDGPSERAAVVQNAYHSLVVSIESMRCAYRLDRESNDILKTLKQAMHVKVPPHDFTVIQALCERERQNVFNEMADTKFPTLRKEFDKAIQDFLDSGNGGTSGRNARKIARNAWKADPGADRRIRETEHLSADKWRSPYRGRPELYDPGVIHAFKDAITEAAGRKFTWTRTIHDNKSTGPMLNVLVAAVHWAMCIAWQISAPPGSEPPHANAVKAEGLLKFIKAKRP